MQWCTDWVMQRAPHSTPLLGLLCQKFFACTVTWLFTGDTLTEMTKNEGTATSKQSPWMKSYRESEWSAVEVQHQCTTEVHCSRFELRSLRRGCCYSFAGIQLLAASRGCLWSTCYPVLGHRYDLWSYQVKAQKYCSHVAGVPSATQRRRQPRNHLQIRYTLHISLFEFGVFPIILSNLMITSTTTPQSLSLPASTAFSKPTRCWRS